MNAPAKSALSAAVLLASALALSGCSLLTGVPEGEQDVFSISVGDCFNFTDDTAGEVSSLPVVDCAEAHDVEAFAATDMPEGDYPGESAVSTELDTFCQGDAFTDFVGLPYADSIYYTTGLTPTQASWDNGDRELLCAIGDPDGQTTGSLEGIGQ